MTDAAVTVKARYTRGGRLADYRIEARLPEWFRGPERTVHLRAECGGGDVVEPMEFHDLTIRTNGGRLVAVLITDRRSQEYAREWDVATRDGDLPVHREHWRLVSMVNANTSTYSSLIRGTDEEALVEGIETVIRFVDGQRGVRYLLDGNDLD